MENLYELAKVTSRQRKVLEMLLPNDYDGPLRKLYTILYSDNHLSDHECMLEIYGKRNVTAFSRLKSRLKEIFYQANILSFSNIQEMEDARIFEALNVFRQTLAARNLITKKLNSVGIEILEKSIQKSLKYHVTENTVGQARMLLSYYSGTVMNKYKFDKYAAILDKSLHMFTWEIKAERYFLDLQKTQLQTLANVSDEIKLKTKRYCDELLSVNDIRTYYFNYNKYRVLAIYYEYEKDYKSLLQLSEDALKEFNTPDFKSGVALSSINIRKLWALIQAGELKEAYLSGMKTMNKTSSGSTSWFRIGYYTLKAQLYSKQYSSAIELISLIMDHPRYQKLGEYYHEIFNTTLGYIHLLVDSGIDIEMTKIRKRLPDFKLGKYLNTTPVFSKDKRGINVSILLMHVAFLLQRKDYNAIIDRTDSLNQYAYRYLRKDDSFRSNCMIKMVIQMTKADFHPIRTGRYTETLRKQLSEVNLAGSGENIEIEIIPFEVLWDIMVKSLRA